MQLAASRDDVLLSAFKQVFVCASLLQCVRVVVAVRRVGGSWSQSCLPQHLCSLCRPPLPPTLFPPSPAFFATCHVPSHISVARTRARARAISHHRQQHFIIVPLYECGAACSLAHLSILDPHCRRPACSPGCPTPHALPFTHPPARTPAAHAPPRPQQQDQISHQLAEAQSRSLRYASELSQRPAPAAPTSEALGSAVWSDGGRQGAPASANGISRSQGNFPDPSREKDFSQIQSSRALESYLFQSR